MKALSLDKIKETNNNLKNIISLITKITLFNNCKNKKIIYKVKMRNYKIKIINNNNK